MKECTVSSEYATTSCIMGHQIGCHQRHSASACMCIGNEQTGTEFSAKCLWGFASVESSQTKAIFIQGWSEAWTLTDPMWPTCDSLCLSPLYIHTQLVSRLFPEVGDSSQIDVPFTSIYSIPHL
jgi:hypothetical protein